MSVCESKVGAVEILGNSKTKDYVIRRLLLLKPGDLITDNRLRRDYEAINNTQFFKTVDLSIKPFGDKCGYVTLVWTVQEQRTGTASVGLSYGGGGTYGQGLSGNISYSESNVDGTGNGASISASRGQYTSNVNFGITVPYLQKFKATSLSVNIFNNVVTNQPYPVYKESGNNPFYSLSPPGGVVTTGPLTATPVPGLTTVCQSSSTPCSSQFADFSSRQAGIAITTGHPVADYTRLYYGISATRLSQEFTAQGFPQSLLDQTTLGVTTPGAGVTVGGSQPAQALRSINASLVRDNRDDVQNPRYGGVTSIYDEAALPFLGSDFHYNKGIFQLTRFYPVRRHSTFGFNFVYGFSSGGDIAAVQRAVQPLRPAAARHEIRLLRQPRAARASRAAFAGDLGPQTAGRVVHRYRRRAVYPSGPRSDACADAGAAVGSARPGHDRTGSTVHLPAAAV